MEYLSVQLDDLPDEILMIILKKMSNVEVFYSLLGVNKRLNQIVHDSIFTSDLTLMKHSSNGLFYRSTNAMFDRFCLQILPEIHHKIEWLNLESLSMERILLVTNYPNLSGLGLYDIEDEAAMHLFTNETSLIHLFKNQISSLIFDIIIGNKNQSFTEERNVLIFTHILTMFNNLICLNFGPSSIWYQRLTFSILPSTISSSTLSELHVSLKYFTDCLYLLEGRFDQLRKLCVKISYILSSHSTVNNKEKLPNLRCFSFHCDMNTDMYDELIIPLLHRMSNLEQLNLHLVVDSSNGFINGNDMKQKISNHLRQLNKFTFNIYSIIPFEGAINLLSNEDIQHTFRDFKDNQIVSYVNYFPDQKKGHCHIYSYPYKITYYNNITNNFPGGLFKCVHDVSLFDERPFQHEFFLRIAQSFPFMKKLTLINKKSQNNKQLYKSNKENQTLSLVEYSYLTELDILHVHDDYVEQFLLDTKTCLPRNLYLRVRYGPLERVTHNFTRDATRINCTKIHKLFLFKKPEFSQYLSDYFSVANIL